MIVDLTPSDDQTAIAHGVTSFLADRLPVERLREAAGRGGAAERALWGELTALGLFGLGLEEDAGGLGLGLPEEVLAARALGRYLISPAVLAQLGAVHFAAGETRVGLIAGTIRAAFANRLDGTAAQLIDGAGAAALLVVDPSGATLIDVMAAGEAEPVSGIDETVALARVAVPGTDVAPGHRLSLLVAAYLVGVAQGAAALATDYAKIREQFGQPIGAFQAIKHMCADMATRAAAAEAQVFHAAVTFGHGLDDESEVAAARMLAAGAALANGKAGIQIHGGMGFTAECDAHLFLKRAHLMVVLGSARAVERHRVLGRPATVLPIDGKMINGPHATPARAVRARADLQETPT